MKQTRLEKKPTQCEKILKVLEEAGAEWTSGRFFIQNMLLSQFHTRIKEIEENGIEIEHSNFKDNFGFKSYRLKVKNTLF